MATGNGPEKPWDSYCVKQPDKHATLNAQRPTLCPTFGPLSDAGDEELTHSFIAWRDPRIGDMIFPE